MELVDVIRVEALEPLRLRLWFDDGTEGELDLGTFLRLQGVFEPLQDPGYFRLVRVDPELGTVVWPNGADLDACALHARVHGRPLPDPRGERG